MSINKIWKVKVCSEENGYLDDYYGLAKGGAQEAANKAIEKSCVDFAESEKKKDLYAGEITFVSNIDF